MRARNSGMPIATARASGNAAFTTAAARANGVSTSTRPNTHSAASAINGAPVAVGWPVQTRTAVNRNPAMTASA